MFSGALPAARSHVAIAWVIVACVSTTVTAQQPSVRQFEDGIRQHIHEIQNLQFEYTVDAKYWTTSLNGPNAQAPRAIQSRDIFRILSPGDLDSDLPWRYWEWKTRNDPNSTWTLEYFVASDGAKTTVYMRRDDFDDDNYSRGTIVPFDASPYYDDNVFDKIMTSDLNAMPAYNDPGWSVSRGLDAKWKWEIDEVTKFDVYKLYILHGQHLERPHLTRVVHIIGPPDYVVVHRESRILQESKNVTTDLLNIESVQRVNGILYPARGSFLRNEFGGIHRVEYLFDVKSASYIDESLRIKLRKEWVPAWPSGTRINDEVNGRNFQVDLAPGQLEEIRRRRGDIFPTGNPMRDMSPTRRVFVIVNVAAFLTVVMVFLYRRRRAQKVASN